MMMRTTSLLVRFFCLPLQFLISKLVLILILECACISYASRSRPPATSRDDALDKAHSLWLTSKIHHALIEKFPDPKCEYSILHFTQFILPHRLRC